VTKLDKVLLYADQIDGGFIVEVRVIGMRVWWIRVCLVRMLIAIAKFVAPNNLSVTLLMKEQNNDESKE
jgi:hypothetical protein